jgi:hypothetical protein
MDRPREILIFQVRKLGLRGETVNSPKFIQQIRGRVLEPKPLIVFWWSCTGAITVLKCTPP